MRSILLFISFLITTNISAQNFWTSVDESHMMKKNDREREIVPEKYDTYVLDYKQITKAFMKAELEDNHKNSKSDVLISLPMPEGRTIEFEIFESPCMSPVLGAKFPEIKSYRGISTDNAYEQARIDFGHMGFHAVIKTVKGTVYIDPYYTYADEHYITYYIKDDAPDPEDLKATCGYQEYREQINLEEEMYENPSLERQKKMSTPVEKRTYRLALACTGQWGSIWNTPQEVMSRFVTGVNRLNIIFENEIGVHFEMIDDNDKLIFFNETEPYSDPGLGGVTLGQNTGVINNAVGFDSYDIGHVFTVRCTDGVAGIAFGGSMCRTNKGGGVSCIGTSNISNFVIGTAAHEVGHQLSGGHSWNNCPGILEQLSASTAWEPGSGSTILSYSGSCGANNVVGPNDDYFHVGNLQQFYEFIENSSCGTIEDSGNNTPDIELGIGDGLMIPISTPFELEASATDPDGDVMTYNWEQMDLGPVSTLGTPIGNAPSFRSYPPSSETTRIFPRLPIVLAGIGSSVEVLPTIDRRLTFRFVVKDNHPGAGATVWEQLRMESSISAGPFIVTEPSQVTFVEVGENYTVEWDVANTDNDIIDCQNVDIYLSTDNGRTFDELLVANTPNDGSETFVIPNIITSSGRIKVKASNNVFFNIGRGDLIIRGPSEPGFYIDISENDIETCLPESIEIDISGTTFQGFTNPVNLEIASGLPANASYTFSENPIAPDGTSTLSIDLSGETDSGIYEIDLVGVSEDADTVHQIIDLSTIGTVMDDLSLILPTSGTSGLTGTPAFQWSDVKNADSYTLEVSTSPEFGPTNTIFETNILETEIIPPVILEDSQLFYWRISSTNKCVEAFESEIFTFGTVSLTCKTYEAEDLPKNISQSGTPSISSTIQVFDQGTIADVNVTKVKGGHGRARDLTATLINPEGTEIELFSSACTGANFNLGFDSDSPLEFGCPLNSGQITKPEETTLFGLAGAEIEGDWELRIDDTKLGEGGRLEEFVLELCSSSSLDNPFITNNFVLEVPTGFSDRIYNDLLLSEDNNNSANELIYTIVVETQKGTLYIQGEPATVGTQFTQAQIDNGLLRYVHNGSEDEDDKFIFTVIDGEGGWIDLTEFIINMGANFTSSVDDQLDVNKFSVFPNPTNNTLNVHCMEHNTETWSLNLISINGQLIMEDQMQSKKSIDVSNLDTGLYLLQIKNKETIYTHKVNIIK